ncbi:MAG: YIP1 family protein [Bacillota bacterium]
MDLKKYILFLFLLFMLATIQTNSEAALPYQSYYYNYYEEIVPSPAPYEPTEIIELQNYNINNLSSPEDFHVNNEKIYIADTGNNRIVILNQDLSSVKIIENFNKGDKKEEFSSPAGIFVTDKEEIYIADRGNRRVLELTKNGEFVREIGSPAEDTGVVLPENFNFRPHKILIPNSGRILLLVEGVYEGILLFDSEGIFQGFIGAPQVTPNPIDYFWRRLATEAQRQRMSLYLPTQYNDFCLSEEGFIYAVLSGESAQRGDKIRKLNPRGDDVLRRMGFFDIVGDLQYPESWQREATVRGPSVFIDVAAYPGDDGIYSALDLRRGRVFTYGPNGNLLYVFGGIGDQKGLFRRPTSIEIMGDKILILDRKTGNITVFTPTEYAVSILQAIHNYNNGYYERSTELWEKVLKLDSNYYLAYSKIGRALLRQDNYVQAMDNFWLGNDREGYSEAFSYYRNQVIKANINGVIILIFTLIIIIYIYKKWREKKNNVISRTSNQEISPDRNKMITLTTNIVNGIRYSLYIIFHPFAGFWDLKHEDKGGFQAAIALIIGVIVTFVFYRQYTGFVFNPRDLNELNIIMEFTSIIIPFILWCIVSWALTTLMDGKGTLMDILISTAYSLTPIIILFIPLTIISNYLTLDEGVFYYFILYFSIFWSVVLLFTATMMTHDYDVSKTVLTIVFVIFGIAFVLFLGLLFFSLIDLMRGLIMDIFNEITLRV